ncbi:MAG: biosynthetic-type acetolactate synthase large subunit [Muribaculaceae bacterium]|nr:biosynthetic-type acetolactate synthase large subunit [Muribaculaceae bacterium]
MKELQEISPENPVSGAEALVRAIIAEGTDTVFGYPGGQILPVYDALYDYTDRLNHILVRHEQGAIHAAQGFARATGRTGVVIVTSGPGAANVVTGLSDAMMDSTPLVVITGQVGAQYLGSDAFQETDVIGITQPITKWSLQVRRAEDINAAVARAFFIARSGRPGPVVLDIARDAQTGIVDTPYRKINFIRSYDPCPALNKSQIEAAAKIIRQAKRPLLLAGQGVAISGAEKALTSFAEKAKLPVANTLLGLSTIPSDHPLYKGMLGMHGNIGPNHNTNRADVIIGVGMRFDDRVTGLASGYAPDAKIIHIDIDPSEFDKVVASTVAVHADAREALEALAEAVGERSNEDGWLESFDRCAEIEDREVFEAELRRKDQAPMTMGEVVAAISEATKHDAIAVTDVGQNQMMASRYFRFRSPRSFISSGGLGTMGFGLPAAMGAKIGRPDRTVVCFLGDGGFQMTVQELGTIMEYGIGVKIVIMNNNFLGNVRQWQNLFYHRRFSQTPLLNPDFNMIASAYGIQSLEVRSRAELPAAIEAMLADDKAFLLNVDIDPTDMVFPMTPAGKTVDTIMLSPDIYFTSEMIEKK